MKVTANNISFDIASNGTLWGVVEASELGFPVDRKQWPYEIECEAGNGEALVANNPMPDGGMEYRQRAGTLRLTVLND